ncbi:MAG: adenosylcobinamide-phosphate synthase CbiB [Desulfobulbus sp.]|jgi:adenosylcobinamide-phosphate synthase
MGLSFLLRIAPLPLAFLLDALLGDPRWLLHPVRWMGRAIERLEPVFRRSIPRARQAGLLFALVLIAGCWLSAVLVIAAASSLHPLLGAAVEVVLFFYCLSARSLREAAMEIHALLHRGEVDAARSKVAMIVGRDVSRYEGDDIARATVETVAENLVDGVLSPLFYAVLGGAPLALAYKMVNTLDSMVGYKNERYIDFGRAAARIDDAANFLPARLSVGLIALAALWVPGASARQALAVARREGAHHASPNAGYPEAAFAGALGVRLNGPNIYHGVLVEKPWIGAGLAAVDAASLSRACTLMTRTSLLGVLVAWLVQAALL